MEDANVMMREAVRLQTEAAEELEAARAEQQRGEQAVVHGWAFRRESQDFMVFYPLGAEPPQAKKEGRGK